MKFLIRSFCVKVNLVLIVIGLLIPFQSRSQVDSTKWWNDRVFYEVFVRSFNDSGGDGIGDFRGLIDKLDYLNDGDSTTHTDLGVTGIWLMPIQQSPSYHGYDVIDYNTVESDYGTNQDFIEFMAAAHDRGIKVIIDYVMNHTSSQHPWFLSSLNSLDNKRDWYIWENPKPSGNGPWGQNVWHYRGGNYNYGIFWSEMPDLNYNNPEVKTEMYDIAEFWLDSMGVDGFRLDAIKFIYEDGAVLQDLPETIEFWEDFRTYYKGINSSALAVGEAWTSTDKVQPYATDSSLDFCFEFDLASSIMSTANSGVVTGLQDQITEVMSTYPYLQFGTFLTNHDMNRVMNQLEGNSDKARLAAELLLTLPGVPFIYYGEEIGMTGVKPDEDIRKPLQWNNSDNAGFTDGIPWRQVNSDYLTKNIAFQQVAENSLWNTYRNKIAIRNQQVALRRGDYKAITTGSNLVISFLRHYDNENIIVVSNASAGTINNIELNLDTSVITQGNYSLLELQGGDSLSVSINSNGSFTNLNIGDIPPRTTFIYKLLEKSKLNSNVEFNIDMRSVIIDGTFDQNIETVDIIAGFNSYGSDSIITLLDLDGDSIYTIDVPNLLVGSNHKYRYRINSVTDERTEFSTNGYLRGYNVTDGYNVVFDEYQRDIVLNLSEEFIFEADVYPNPATDNFDIKMPSDHHGSVEYTIVDLTGIVVMKDEYIISNQPHSVKCDGLTSGLYFLNLKSNGSTKTIKIVLQ